MKVRFLNEAIAESEYACSWYEKKKQGLGDKFLFSLDRSVDLIINSPLTWPIVTSIDPKRELRTLTLGSFPFAIIYEVRTEELIVLAIAHLHKRPGYWKNRLTSFDQ